RTWMRQYTKSQQRVQRRNAWIYERDRIIKRAYRAIRKERLPLEREPIEEFVWDNIQTPVIHEYDLGGAPAHKSILTLSQASRLVTYITNKILDGYSLLTFAAVQAWRARKRWDGKSKTLEDLARVAGLSIREQAKALGCS